MATKKKQVATYLDAEDYARLKRAADSTDSSVSKTLAELVQSAAPMLDRVADLADAIRDAPDDMRATFAGAAAELQRRGEEVLRGGDEMWELFDRALGLDGDDEGGSPRVVTRGPES